MGIDTEYELMAKEVQENAHEMKNFEATSKMVLQLETILLQSFVELQEEYNLIRNNKA